MSYYEVRVTHAQFLRRPDALMAFHEVGYPDQQKGLMFHLVQEDNGLELSFSEENAKTF